MTYTQLVVLIAVILALAALFLLPAKAELPEPKAREHLKHGAIVIDVRTVEEFNSAHLAGVTNIPLADLKTKLPKVVTNKSDIILLHCRTGRRSGIAERELRSLGYTNAFNIGSYNKAQKLLADTPQKHQTPKDPPQSHQNESARDRR